MSQLSQLKETVSSLARQAKASGGQLGQFGQSFGQQTSAVEQAIGGSAAGADRKFVESLNQAKTAVDRAVEALNSAAQTAESYANGL